MPTESKTSVRRLEAAERQRRALEMRRAGATFEVIAKQLGWRSGSGAYQAVMAALRRTQQEPADVLRRLELERIDRLWLEMFAQATSDEQPPAVKQAAVDRLVKLAERRARLLGLDAPKRVAVGGDAEAGPVVLRWADDGDGDGGG